MWRSRWGMPRMLDETNVFGSDGCIRLEESAFNWGVSDRKHGLELRGQL